MLTTPNPSSVAEQKQNATVKNNPFYPDIETETFRRLYAVDSKASRERVSIAIVRAIDAVNSELSVLRLELIAQGYSALSQVPESDGARAGEKINNYREAVFSHAYAQLCGYNDEGEKKQETKQYFSRSRDYIARICGRSLVIVDLL